ncbi:MAG: hypothetical protein IT440_03725 [Phycisphaeraceae bacterium]|nr:hypothetical protein [Phycisphaeraceae bacterium]
MQTRRIELEGSAGHVAMERPRNSATIRIDCIMGNPQNEEQTWKTWEIDPSIGEDELFRIAQEIQRRCDGVRGSNSMVHDVLRELQRFTD